MQRVRPHPFTAGTCVAVAGAFLILTGMRGSGRELTPEQAELLQYMSLVKLPDGAGGQRITVRVSGADLQIVNGAGATDTVNGHGNLIVGYDELGFDTEKTGSHNLVVGTGHGYTSHAGVVFGIQNELEAPHATVTGGRFNAAKGYGASVGGGSENQARGVHSSVSGGKDNTALGEDASVAGGQVNFAVGTSASISGGFGNNANGNWASIAGGNGCFADGDHSAVSGGFANTAEGEWATVAGGWLNTASGERSAVSGGCMQDNAVDCTVIP